MREPFFLRREDVDGDADGGEGWERFENPLMPDERLRQMYTAMVQVRRWRRTSRRGHAARRARGRC